MARYFMLCLWSSTQFWLSAVCTLSLLQLLTVIFALPMILTIGNVMWLSIVVIPTISVALMCTAIEPAVMTRATYKQHNSVNLEVIFFVLWCYGCKFLPTILLLLSTYGGMLMKFCDQISAVHNFTECTIIYPTVKKLMSNDTNKNLEDKSSEDSYGLDFNFYPEWGGWGDLYQEGYILSQQICFFMLFLLIVTISVSFVHREHLLWQKNVLSNRMWVKTVIVLLILQLVYLFGMLYFLKRNIDSKEELTFYIPPLFIVSILVSPFLILGINEFIKWQEVKVNLRYQRRARLDFGTKLGMNSPF